MTWLAVVRAVHFAAAIQVIGAFLFIWIIAGAQRLPGGAESSRSRTLARLALFCVLIAAGSAVAWFALQVADMSEQSVIEAWANGAVFVVLFKTQAGIVWWVRLGMLVALAALAIVLARNLFRPPRCALAAVLILAAANLMSCAWLSHAAADASALGPLHLGIHAVHMLSVACWIGGLIPLAIILSGTGGAPDNYSLAFVHHAGRRFSDVALLAVALIVLTGVANTALLVEDASDLTGGAYARLLAAKVFLFLVMLALAATNRQLLLPQLAAAKPSLAIVWLRRSVLAEIVLAAVVLLIAGALGITPPSAEAE